MSPWFRMDIKKINCMVLLPPQVILVEECELVAKLNINKLKSVFEADLTGKHSKTLSQHMLCFF
jgi:hypothetical protein